MAVQHKGIEGRSDVYRINPQFIHVEEGWNPRISFGDEEDEELKNSIIENGVLIPIRVKRNDEGFVLVDGERRLRAVKQAISEENDIQNVPAIIERKTLSEVDAMIVSLLANTGKPLSPIEEANAFEKLKNWGVSVQNIAKKMGKSTPYIYDRLKLVDASPRLKESIKNKKVTLGVAKNIIEEAEGSIQKQDNAIEQIISGGITIDKRKSPKNKEENTTNVNQPPIPKNKNIKVNQEDIQDLLDEAVKDYKETEDEQYKQFCGGMIRAYSNVLETSDPIELNY